MADGDLSSRVPMESQAVSFDISHRIIEESARHDDLTEKVSKYEANGREGEEGLRSRSGAVKAILCSLQRMTKIPDILCKVEIDIQ